MNINALPTGKKASLIYLWALKNNHGSQMDRLIASRFLATADADGCFRMRREDIRSLVPRGDWAIKAIVTSLEHSGLVERLGRTSWRLCPQLLESMREWMQLESEHWRAEGLVLPRLQVVPVLTARGGTEEEQAEFEEQSGLFGTTYEHAYYFEQEDAVTRSSDAGVVVWEQLLLFSASLPVANEAAHEVLTAVAATFEPELGEVIIDEADLEAATGLTASSVRELMNKINRQGIYDIYQEGTTWEVSLTALGAATLQNWMCSEN